MSEDASGSPCIRRHRGLGWQPLWGQPWLSTPRVARQSALAMLPLCYSTPKTSALPLALSLHNPSTMRWTQEAKIFPVLQQRAALPAQALCQASNCAMLNPSYFYSISCNCQRHIRCLPLIMAAWCCLFKSCTTRAKVNQSFASHCNEKICHTTSANLHANTYLFFLNKTKKAQWNCLCFYFRYNRNPMVI